MKTLSAEEIPKQLLNEAIEALDLGLEFINRLDEEDNENRAIQQSTIHLFRFVEFILKYFISEFNPLLIFADSFCKEIDLKKLKTITFDNALNFYINNLEWKLIETPSDYNQEAFKKQLNNLRKSRNEIMHFGLNFDPDKERKLHDLVLELMSYVFLDHDIEKNIRERLSAENWLVLKEKIDYEQKKIYNANKKIEEYINKHTSSDLKDSLLNPFRDELIYDCSECGENSMFFLEKKELFECQTCGHQESGDCCCLARRCNGNLVPESSLSEWSEDGAMACANCQDFSDLD